jgi:hypothetical protein
VAVLLVGANPGLTLYGSDSERVAFASVWRVDWSVHGSGRALVLWHEGRTRVVTETPELGRWLAEAYARHFPEVDGLPWPEPELTVAPVALELDLATGMRATADDVTVVLADPLDRRVVSVERFPGNGLRLSNVYIPCRTASLTISGRAVNGAPEVAGTRSSAFLADAEVWSEA